MKIIRVQKPTVLLVAGIVMLGTGVATAQASSPRTDDHKVTLCHRTGSDDGGNLHDGYTLITVDIASVANAKDVHGHDSHDQIGNGPGGDIIPSYSYEGYTYPGKNLGNGGAEFLDRDCEEAEVPPDTTTTTATTPPDTTTTTATTPPDTTTTTATTPPDTTTTTATTPPTTGDASGGDGVGVLAPPVRGGGVGSGGPVGVVAQPAAQPPVLGSGAAANPLPAAASAGEADTSGQLVAGGLAAFAGFIMVVAGFVLRRRHGEV